MAETVTSSQTRESDRSMAGTASGPRPRGFARSGARWFRFNGLVLGVYVLVVALWQVISDVFSVPVYILPSPGAILERAAQSPGLLLSHMWVTLTEVAVGFGLATLVSVPLGVLLVYSRVMERVVYPALVAFQATPKVALAPILVVWFGFGLSSKVALALMTAAFPIVINTVIGMKQTPQEILHLFRVNRASSWQIFYKARLPIAAPYIFGGLKIGITLAVVGAVVGEFIASNRGLGYLLLVANNTLDTPMLFAVVLVLAMMSAVLFYLVEALEILLLPRPLRQSDQMADPGVTA